MSAFPFCIPRRTGVFLLAFACVLASTLTGCGGGGNPPTEAQASPPPSPPPKTPQVIDTFALQPLQWHDCPADVTGPVPEPLAGRLQCAEIKLPLDYQRANAGTATMALSRIAAGDPEKRRGVLVLNPGGPGGDGLLNLPIYLSGLWGAANADTAAGLALRRLAAEYDLIGFSPRGVGGSTQLVCSSNRVLPTVANASYDRSDAKIATLLEGARRIAQACQSNPLTRYFSTESTAHDLELLRRVLGEQKINYYGYSYGTWLGKWFESLYPASVDRMVLDSSMSFPGSFDDNLANQIMGRQRVVDEVLAPAIALRDPLYRMGTTPALVRQEIRRWNPLVQTLAGNNLPIASSHEFELSLDILGAARGLDQIIAAMSGPVSGSAIASATLDHTFSADPAHNETMRWFAYGMAFQYDALEQQPTQPMLWSPFVSLNRAVVCNDTDSNPDPGFWITRGNDFAQRYPLLGGTVTENPCMFWGGATVRKPPGASQARILMVQDEFDPLTVREGAFATFDTLPNASMVFVHNEYVHGVFPYGNACVDEPVANYLLGVPPAGRRIDCDGDRLPSSTTAPAASRSASVARQAVAPPIYGTDPASVHALEAIRSVLARNALDLRAVHGQNR